MTKKFILLIGLVFSLESFSQGLSVINLKCENKISPLGIEKAPNLSWQLRSSQRNVLQTGYRILVADKPELLANNTGNVWDSKKVNSDQSIQVSYKGKKLAAAKTYYWKVIVWDNKNNVSKWSEPTSWQMGLLAKSDWKSAKWIALEKLPDSLKIIPALENRGPRGLADVKNTLPLLRKNFTINKPVKKAVMFISGLGQFELSINGKKAGDHFLDPGWTQFDKEALYVTFDVTDQLQKGNNAIGTAAVVEKDNALFIRGMAVLPGARGLGAGLKLLQEIEKYAIENHLPILSLTTTPYLSSAINLYEKFGFRKFGETDNSFFGTLIFTMKKNL